MKAEGGPTIYNEKHLEYALEALGVKERMKITDDWRAAEQALRNKHITDPHDVKRLKPIIVGLLEVAKERLQPQKEREEDAEEAFALLAEEQQARAEKREDEPVD